MPKIAVVVLSHMLNAHVLKSFSRLRAQAPQGYDLFLALNLGEKQPLPPEENEPVRDALFLFNTEALLALPYPAKCRREGWSLPGNEDLNFLIFRAAHPDYDYYWGIEYDVHYEGDWRFLFDRFAPSPADLIGTTLYQASKTPGKILTPPLREADGREYDLAQAVRGLYPIFRLSGRAARTIDEAYRSGIGGHYELAWGAICKRKGLVIEDFGGNGEFVRLHNRNAFYFNTPRSWSLSPGNFVFRPAFTKAMPYENSLWHPVKPDNIYNWFSLKVKGGLIKNVIEMIKPIVWKIGIWGWFAVCRRDPRAHPVNYTN
jgi:hypothetical protein